GSLRQEIANTAAGGTVDFAPGLTGTITLTSVQITINKSLTIAGPGAGVLAVSGNNASRIFNLAATGTPAASISISGLTPTKGNASGGSGGAILDAGGGTLTIADSALTGNTSDYGGGALSTNGVAVTITNTTISGNTTGGTGGGLSLRGQYTMTV